MTDDRDPKAKRAGTNANGAAAAQSSAVRNTLRSQSETRLYPLVELTLTRIREFIREPEVVFWVFIFPVLLACALGIAFRNTAPERIRVAVEDDGSRASSSSARRRIVAALEKSADGGPGWLAPE